MQRCWVVAFLVFSFGLSNQIWGQSFLDIDRVNQAVKDPLWFRLLHIDEVDLSSKVLSSGFYLSEFQKDTSFIKDELILNYQKAKTDPGYICQFPARYHFLQKHFKDLIKTTKDCPELSRWKKDLKVKSLSLVYPNHSMGSSLAVFSHTFLKLNSENLASESSLNIAVSYAAELDPKDSLPSLAIKGFFGGYVGKFGNSYYYEELNRYSESEYRDIYEYELNLDSEEIDRLLNHIWEVKDVQFRYFFLRGNCSYYLLLLLDIARPSLSLSSRYRFVTVPSESLKTIYFDSGLVKKVIWLPSKKTRQDLAKKEMNQLQINFVEQSILNNGIDQNQLKNQFTSLEQIALLDYLIMYLRDPKNEHNGFYDSLRENALGLRSQLPQSEIRPKTESKNESQSEKDFPHLSHGAMATYWGVGAIEDEAYFRLKYRFVLHSMLDPDRGYFKDSDLELASVDLKYFDSKKTEFKFYGSQLTLANISVLKPESKNLLDSWIGRSSFTNYGSNRWNFQNQYAFGKAFSWSLDFTVYGMLSSRLNIDSHYKDGYKFNFDPVIGGRYRLNERHKIRFEALSLHRLRWNIWYSLEALSGSIQAMVGEDETANPESSNLEKRYEANYVFYF